MIRGAMDQSSTQPEPSPEPKLSLGFAASNLFQRSLFVHVFALEFFFEPAVCIRGTRSKGPDL